jgi:hypothetical protein
MKKAFPVALMLIGLVFLVAGVYTVSKGFDAKNQVRDEMAAQKIVTPDDASIPGVPVVDAATAQSMADIIGVHANEATGGRTFSEMGRFLAVGGGDTSDEAEAMLDEEGNPIANPLRNVAFQASALRTSLFTSVMAFNVADLVVGLGIAFAALGFVIGGVGVALGGLVIPALGRRLHVEPIAATRHVEPNGASRDVEPVTTRR